MRLTEPVIAALEMTESHRPKLQILRDKYRQIDAIDPRLRDDIRAAERQRLETEGEIEADAVFTADIAAAEDEHGVNMNAIAKEKLAAAQPGTQEIEMQKLRRATAAVITGQLISTGTRHDLDVIAKAGHAAIAEGNPETGRIAYQKLRSLVSPNDVPTDPRSPHGHAAKLLMALNEWERTHPSFEQREQTEQERHEAALDRLRRDHQTFRNALANRLFMSLV